MRLLPLPGRVLRLRRGHAVQAAACLVRDLTLPSGSLCLGSASSSPTALSLAWANPPPPLRGAALWCCRTEKPGFEAQHGGSVPMGARQACFLPSLGPRPVGRGKAGSQQHFLKETEKRAPCSQAGPGHAGLEISAGRVMGQVSGCGSRSQTFGNHQLRWPSSETPLPGTGQGGKGQGWGTVNADSVSQGTWKTAADSGKETFGIFCPIPSPCANSPQIQGAFRGKATL